MNITVLNHVNRKEFFLNNSIYFFCSSIYAISHFPSKKTHAGISDIPPAIKWKYVVIRVEQCNKCDYFTLGCQDYYQLISC